MVFFFGIQFSCSFVVTQVSITTDWNDKPHANQPVKQKCPQESPPNSSFAKQVRTCFDCRTKEKKHVKEKQ